MDANVESRQKEKTTNPTDPPPSFSSLPDDIVVNSLARVPRSLVSKSFHSILSSPEIYSVRSHIGTTEPCLYICLKLPSNHHRWFTLDETLMITNDGENKDEFSLAPLIPSPSDSPAPSKSTTVAVGSEIYQFRKRSSAVRVLDCLSHTWRRAPSMAVTRDRAKSIVLLDGKIYVLGGCKRREDECMKWGEVLDLKTQTWKPIPIPTGNALNYSHNVLVLGGKLYIITGHRIYAYDPKQGRWKETRLDVCFLSCLGLKHRPSWCVIENVMISDYCGMYRWWGTDSSYGMVHGLSDLYMKRARNFGTIQLLNHGGKLVILWYEWVEAPVEMKRIVCAVIRLEERISNFKPEIWGQIERFNVLCTVPKSYKLLSCLSVCL